MLDLPTATGVEDARWEHFQLAHLNDDSVFRVENKSRQVAWSWLSAAEAVANAIVARQPSVFVSINLAEATEKIRYARQIIEALPPTARPRIARNNELGLELADGTRLLSLPATPPRGKARFWVYLDEFAHVQRDRHIYTAALPIISKGGVLRMGSSPMGASGVFWEVFTEALRPYPGYSRKTTPWWEVSSFCLDVQAARVAAPGLMTSERVARFGNERIQLIYANMPEEDFRQEYEAEFVDEATAWITWEEIKAVTDESLLCRLATARETRTEAATDAIDDVARWVSEGKVEMALAAGVDVGRTRNTTELAIVGLTTVGSYPLRLNVSLDNMPFDSQLDVLTYALAKLPLTQMLIDQNGIGRNLAESLARRFGGKAEGVDFTNATKTLWVTDAKMLVQQAKTPLPNDRDLAYQIHSIKRMVTPSRNLVFDSDRAEKHHADKFWGWALALAAATSGRVFGYAVGGTRADVGGLRA